MNKECVEEKLSIAGAVGMVVVFAGILFNLVGAKQDTIPEVNSLRNKSMEWEIKGNEATLRNMLVTGSPVVLTTEVYAEKDGRLCFRNPDQSCSYAKPVKKEGLVVYEWGFGGDKVEMLSNIEIHKQQRRIQMFKDYEYRKNNPPKEIDWGISEDTKNFFRLNMMMSLNAGIEPILPLH